MIDVYTIANWTTGIFEAYFSFVLFNAFLHKRQDYPKWIYGVGIVCLAVLINVSNGAFSISLVHVITTVTLSFLTSFLYEGRHNLRILASILSFMVSAMAEVLTLLLLSVIFNQQAEIIIDNGIFRLLGIAFSKLLGCGCINYIGYRAKRELELLSTNYWLLFTITFASITITMYTFCKVVENNTSAYIRNLIIVCTCGLIIITVAVLYLYEKTLKQQFSLTKQQLSQMQLNSQIKHYKGMIKSQNQIRSVKHDLKNHLLSINAKLKKKEYEECSAYVNSLFEGVSEGINIVDTGNTVLDAILSAKKEEAEKKNIKFTMKLCIPSKLPIAEDDICIIFGNSLDNAIEACEKVKNAPYISVLMSYNRGTLTCKIENSCGYKPDMGQVTTKKDADEHGLGKMNIEKALKRYNGVFRTYHDENKYILSIVLMNINNN